MNPRDIIPKLKQYPIPVAASVIIIVIGVLLFLRKPHVNSLRVAVEEEVKVLEQIQKNVEQSLGLEEDVTLIEAYQEEINTRLIASENVAINYAYFYNLERRTGVRIANISQQPALDPKALPQQFPEMKTYGVIPYNLVIEGTFSQILDFSYQLERGSFLVRMESTTVSESTQNAQALTSVRLEVFVLGRKNNAS